MNTPLPQGCGTWLEAAQRTFAGYHPELRACPDILIAARVELNELRAAAARASAPRAAELERQLTDARLVARAVVSGKFCVGCVLGAREGAKVYFLPMLDPSDEAAFAAAMEGAERVSLDDEGVPILTPSVREMLAKTLAQPHASG